MIIDLKSYLLENNWKQYETYDSTVPERIRKLYCKQLKNCTYCSSNEKEPNLCLNYIEFDIGKIISKSVTVGIHGEINNKIWYALEAYSMTPEEFIENEKEIVASLIRAWEALHE